MLKIEAARVNPNDFLELCLTDHLHQPIKQAVLHRELQAFLTAHSRALIELPRDHGKTMQVCGRILWELGRQPGLRIKIVCATEAIAAQRGRFLRETIERNPLLRQVFPHLQPAYPWSDTAFTIDRPANTIGPSVASFGIGNGSTGTRADLLVCDDIVDVKSLHSKADRERVKENFRNNLLNLLDPKGRFWGLFTPWHRSDLNAELKSTAAYALFRRAIPDDLQPIWPERWSKERLEQRRQEIGLLSFARAYRLLPMSEEESVIRPEWIHYWIETEPIQRLILSVDPAVSSEAKADASALVILGEIESQEIRCLEAIARRVTTPQLVDLIASTDRRWKPDLILFEANAAFRGIKDLLIHRTNFGSKIVGIQQTKDKWSRASAFSVSVENGRFRLQGIQGNPHPVVGQQALLDEMLTFPHGEHDDLLDATMSGVNWLLEQREIRVW